MIEDNINNFLIKLHKGHKIMALDLGKARIGIAVSDLEHIIANPLEVYTRRNISKDLGHINQLAKNEQVGYFVIGLPLSLDGSEGENCIVARQFAAKLLKKTGMPILMQDERFSTKAVHLAMIKDNISRKERHNKDDKLAASYVLQMVLDVIRR